MTRRTLAQQLEQQRLRKQSAAPRSPEWYDADSKIETLTRQLYAGRHIELLTDEEE